MTGRIEIDDAYLVGEKAGERGRGSLSKITFVDDVETTQDGRPVKIQPRRVRGGVYQREIDRFAKACLAPGSDVVLDGLWCFKGVTEAACTHSAIVPAVDAKVPSFRASNVPTPCSAM